MKKSDKPYNAKQPYVVGRKLFAKISAVEGIDLNGAIRQELEEFDRLGLSQAARRKIVRERFVKKAS